MRFSNIPVSQIHCEDIPASHMNSKNGFEKSTEHFFELLKLLQISEEDITVSFDTASLFTKLPVEETLQLI